ncbi:MAG: aldo/keto reductase [Anaerolineae bacterium]|jgi:aryl-alcohol dehydrogenase-like predicted oxidoreductase|nr:aldo/keto reductase [Chloroflexota bacterium]
MEQRQLGGAGIRVSAVGLGTGGQWGGRVDQEGAIAILWAALDAGVTYVDTADIYGTWYRGTSTAEEMLGEALQGIRHRVVLGTKGCQAVGPGPNQRGSSRGHLMQALEQSLRRLRTDYVDLYQVHQYDPSTSDQETMRALDDMVSSGKVRYVGASNYPAWRITRCNGLAERYGWAPLVTTQAHYNLLEREAENELLPMCRALGVGLLPYFPLANGLLAGRYAPGSPPPADSRAAAFERTRRYLARYATPEGYAALARLDAWAAARGHTLAELAIAWLLAQPAVSCVITGASAAWQIQANAEAAQWQLSAGELGEIDHLLAPSAQEGR